MQNPAEFRNYAKECKRLAEQHPEIKASLLKMAEAWMAAAEEAEDVQKSRKK
ncbi:MAG TPA: hypothetical protein VH249_09420 [Xanthobacteraceae bacterium]|jgi:hypothetical protein|nr:hypothetical protein [Xanthobacteraceae bacterium]